MRRVLKKSSYSRRASSPKKKHWLVRIPFVSRSVHWVLPFLVKPVWRIVDMQRRLSAAWPRPTRRVLLICQNDVAADHLRPIFDLLQEDRRIKARVANDHFPAQEISNKKIAKMFSGAYLNILFALFIPWDLVIYVNHPWGFASWISPSIRKIYINHGLYAGKINNSLGEDGVYGDHRVRRKHRGLLYHRMFVASSAELRSALSHNPSLKGCLRVVGSLVCDEVISRHSRKSQIRRRLDLPPESQVIHVISTWGPSSLAVSSGGSLLEKLARRDRSKVRVLVSIHPRFDKFGGVAQLRDDMLASWSAIGAVVDHDNSKWMDFVAAADVAISDHSSLGLYHVILGNLIYFVPIPDLALMEDAVISVVRDASPVFDVGSDIFRDMEFAASWGGYPDSLRDLLVADRGRARNLHMAEIRRCLNIGP